MATTEEPKKKPKKSSTEKKNLKVPVALQGEISSAGSYFGQLGRSARFAPTAYNPDELAQKKGLKIYRKMAQDEQIKSALLAKKYAVLSAGYEIELPEIEDEDDEEAKEIEQQDKAIDQPPLFEKKDGEEDVEEFALEEDDEEDDGFDWSDAEQQSPELPADPGQPVVPGQQPLQQQAEKKTDKDAEEYKRFIEFVFGEMKGSFESKIIQIMSALEFGHSCSEKIFGLIDYGPFEGKIGLKDLRTRPPEDIEYYTDGFGTLVENGVAQAGIKMPAAKFVIYSYRPIFGNYYGNSDLREAYRAWWSKDNMLKLLAIALERYGEPIAVVTHDGILTDPQKAEIEKFLKYLQSRSGIILPKGVELDFKNPPPRTAEAFVPAINLYDQHLRIAVLMPGLLGLSGEASTGSYARAVTEFDVFLWILGQLRKDLETLVNEQIIKPLLDMNFEIEHGKYPRFKFKAVTEDERRRQFELFITGLSTGALIKGPDDENKLRELIDWDPLPEDYVPPQPGLPPGLMPPGAEGEDPNAEEDVEEEDGEEFFFSRRAAPRRPKKRKRYSTRVESRVARFIDSLE